MKTKALILGLMAVMAVTQNSSAQGGKGGSGTAKPKEVTGLLATDAGAAGPTIQWNAIDKATYQVQRSKSGDTSCCNNASPTGLTSPTWDDSPLPSSGTYIYRVIATFASGQQVTGQTQYTYTAPARTGHFRLSIRSIQIAKPTIDDATASDGNGDEIYAAAAVVRVDRATGAKLEATVVKSKEYGDIGSGQTWPNRIRAGSASPSGGIAAGNSVGDPGTPGAETFPFVLWEGDLTAGGEAVVIFPSLWERDTDDFIWKDYSSNWMSASAPILGSASLRDQYNSTRLAPFVATPTTGQVQQGVTGPVYGNYIIGTTWLSGADRMIGMMANNGNIIYSEQLVVLTQEKLASLAVGGTTVLQIPLMENIPPGGSYTMILQVDRIGQ